jgi:AAA domain
MTADGKRPIAEAERNTSEAEWSSDAEQEAFAQGRAAGLFRALPKEDLDFIDGGCPQGWSPKAFSAACVQRLRRANGWTVQDAINLAAGRPGLFRGVTAEAIEDEWDAASVGGAGPELKRCQLITPSECAAAPPRGYLIKGLIAPADLAIVFGAPGAGKSVIAPYLAYAVAQGREVFGRRVRPGRVLYVPAEDTHGMKARIHALMLEQGDAPDFRLAEGIGDLFSPTSPDRQALRDAVVGFQPALIVIDTLAAAFPGLRENEAEDMGRAVDFLRSLTATGAAVVLVHHCPKADESTPRGHSSLNGAADVGLRLNRDGTMVRGGLSKNRNGASDATLSFSIRSERIDEDEDGDAITAPILEEADASGHVRLGRAEGMARKFLTDLIASEGKPLPAGRDFPTGPLGVSMERWRAECASRGLSASDKADSARKAFVRAAEGLTAKRETASRDGIVWLVNP